MELKVILNYLSYLGKGRLTNRLFYKLSAKNSKLKISIVTQKKRWEKYHPYIYTRKTQLRISDAILAWGGSSSLTDGRKLCFRQECKRFTKAGACFSIEPVSLKIHKEGYGWSIMKIIMNNNYNAMITMLLREICLNFPTKFKYDHSCNRKWTVG